MKYPTKKQMSRFSINVAFFSAIFGLLYIQHNAARGTQEQAYKQGFYDGAEMIVDTFAVIFRQQMHDDSTIRILSVTDSKKDTLYIDIQTDSLWRSLKNKIK